MTKKEKKTFEKIRDDIDHIVNWDNRNLKKDQYYRLSDALDALDAALGER